MAYSKGPMYVQLNFLNNKKETQELRLTKVGKRELGQIKVSSIFYSR